MADRKNAHPVLVALGERVRAKRLSLGLTLKQLAERSELSERFLVGLEHGYSNVSVLNLVALAIALGEDASSLLRGVPSSRGASAPRGRTIVSLVGLRGAGKSTIGRAAAERLRVPFVELDSRIAERAGMTAGEIFDVHGTAYYRRLERAEVERVLAAPESAIVATAGSLVTDHATYDLLLEKTIVVWLKASAEDHHDRVLAQGDKRPMADRKDAMAELRAILRARRALYERAAHVIDTSRLGLDRSVASLVRIFEAGGDERRARGPIARGAVG
jgi:XRE family aerobic/anaerobic benzoate catabolism transcriptional regulator